MSMLHYTYHNGLSSANADANKGNNNQGFAIAKGSNPTISHDYTINSITPNGTTVSVDITNNTGKAGTLMVASYNGKDILLAVNAMNVTKTGVETIGLNTSGAKYVKAFIWDGISSMRPISLSKRENIN